MRDKDLLKLMKKKTVGRWFESRQPPHTTKRKSNRNTSHSRERCTDWLVKRNPKEDGAEIAPPLWHTRRITMTVIYPAIFSSRRRCILGRVSRPGRLQYVRRFHFCYA